MNLDLNNPEGVKNYIEEVIKDSERKYGEMKAMYILAEALNVLLPEDENKDEELKYLKKELEEFKQSTLVLKELGALIIKLAESGSDAVISIPNITKKPDIKWN